MISRILQGAPRTIGRAHMALVEPRLAGSAVLSGPRVAGGGPHYRTVWISDVHLGTRVCQAARLCAFLENVRCETLYLVGDIVDVWQLRRRWFWSESQTRVIELVLEMARTEGTRVVFVPGNHDEVFRARGALRLAEVEVRREALHVTADGRRLLVLHGDEFDAIVRNHRWLAHLGDRAYVFTLHLNRWFNAACRLCGYPYWSLSGYVKRRVKDAVGYCSEFERAVAAAARLRGVDGVVCGHIHKAELRDVDGVLYANDGDWVESCTALCEDRQGRLSIVEWREEPALRAPAPEGAELEVAL